MSRTTTFLSLTAALTVGGAGCFLLPTALPALLPSAGAAAQQAPVPAQASPEDASDPFTVETLPAQVSATVGEPIVLPPRRINGGTPPFARSLTGGKDVMLASLGAIRIAPDAPGTSGPYTFTVTDARGRTASTEMHLVASLPLAMRGAPAPVATVGVPYEAKFTVSGGRQPYAWSFSGLSPAGLSFVNGVLSGVPRQAGTSPGMVVTATDADGRQTYSGEFSVDASDALSIQSLPPAVAVTVGEVYRLPAPAVGGGSSPYTVSLSGPPGATLNPDGSLSLAPQAKGTLGPYVVTAKDARGRTVRTQTSMVAMESLRVSTYADMTLASRIEASVPGPGVVGGTPPYAFSLVGETATSPTRAPPGLALSRRDGALAGIPSVPGRHGPFRIHVTDASGRTADSLAFSVTVADASDATTDTPREVYVNGQRFCASHRGDDCSRPGQVDSIEIRYASLQKVSELSFGCEFTSVPGGVWEISDGRGWTTVTPTNATPCTAAIPATAVRSVRYNRIDGAFTKIWAPRATLSR